LCFGKIKHIKKDRLKFLFLTTVSDGFSDASTKIDFCVLSLAIALQDIAILLVKSSCKETLLHFFFLCVNIDKTIDAAGRWAF